MVCSKSLTSVVRNDASWPMLFCRSTPGSACAGGCDRSLRSAVMSRPELRLGVVRRVQRGAHDEQHDERAAVERKQLGVERAGDELMMAAIMTANMPMCKSESAQESAMGSTRVLALSPATVRTVLMSVIMPATPSSPCGACRRPHAGVAPSCLIRESCVPRSRRRPWSNTHIWSACTMVCRRWAIMMQVLFVSRCESASWIRCSFSMSVKLVASSNTMMGASSRWRERCTRAAARRRTA